MSEIELEVWGRGRGERGKDKGGRVIVSYQVIYPDEC